MCRGYVPFLVVTLTSSVVITQVHFTELCSRLSLWCTRNKPVLGRCRTLSRSRGRLWSCKFTWAVWLRQLTESCLVAFVLRSFGLERTTFGGLRINRDEIKLK